MKAANEIRHPMHVSAVVKLGEDSEQEPDAAACLDFDEGPGWDAKALGAELVALARTIDPQTRYSLSITENHLCWGADASAAEAMIYIGVEAAKLLGGALLGDVVRRSFDRIARASSGKLDPLDRERAVGYATLRVATAFSESAKDLAVSREVEIAPGKAWTIDLLGASGNSYSVTIERVRRRAVSTLITRTRPAVGGVKKEPASLTAPLTDGL